MTIDLDEGTVCGIRYNNGNFDSSVKVMVLGLTSDNMVRCVWLNTGNVAEMHFKSLYPLKDYND